MLAYQRKGQHWCTCLLQAVSVFLEVWLTESSGQIIGSGISSEPSLRQTRYSILCDGEVCSNGGKISIIKLEGTTGPYVLQSHVTASTTILISMIVDIGNLATSQHFFDAATPHEEQSSHQRAQKSLDT